MLYVYRKYNIHKTSWCIFILIFIAVNMSCCMCTVNIIFIRLPGVFLYDIYSSQCVTLYVYCTYNILQTSWCIFILIFIAIYYYMSTVNIIFFRLPGVYSYYCLYQSVCHSVCLVYILCSSDFLVCSDDDLWPVSRFEPSWWPGPPTVSVFYC